MEILVGLWDFFFDRVSGTGDEELEEEEEANETDLESEDKEEEEEGKGVGAFFGGGVLEGFFAGVTSSSSSENSELSLLRGGGGFITESWNCFRKSSGVVSPFDRQATLSEFNHSFNW